MATMTIKSTYSFDVQTHRTLEELARRWEVSRSEALRRAIRIAASQAIPPGEEAVRALDELQQSLGLAPEGAARWEEQVRTERKIVSRRGEGRSS